MQTLFRISKFDVCLSFVCFCSIFVESVKETTRVWKKADEIAEQLKPNPMPLHYVLFIVIGRTDLIKSL